MPLTFTRRAAAAGLLTGIVAVGTGIGPATAQSRSAATESKSAAAQHAEIDRLIKVVDRSGSGKISFDDARQFVLERFDKLDSDKDGTLTLQELQAPMRERIRAAQPAEKRRLESSLKLLEAELKAMDKNKDGAIDKDEFVALVKARFDAANRDKDQTLEPSELGSPAGHKVLLLLGALITGEAA